MAKKTYEKHDWVEEEVISEARLDAMEDGIENAHELANEKVSLPTEGNGTDGQILVTVGDGTTRWEDKPANAKRGSIWTVGTALSGEASDKVFEGSALENSLVGDMYLNSTSFEVYKCTKEGNATTATWTKVGVIKGTDGADGETREAMPHIANATGQEDAHTVLNSLLAELIAKGYMSAE